MKIRDSPDYYEVEKKLKKKCSITNKKEWRKSTFFLLNLKPKSFFNS